MHAGDVIHMHTDREFALFIESEEEAHEINLKLLRELKLQY